jgi:hypothetical protein
VAGRPENCESAKEALLEQVPVRVEVDVPFEMHRFIIGTLLGMLVWYICVNIRCKPIEA